MGSMHVIGDLLDRSISQPVHPGAREVQVAIQQLLSPAIHGQEPIQNAVKEAERLGQVILDEFWAGDR